MAGLPPYVSRDLVAERLPLIFPEGTPNRTYCVRELAASTVFTMLYIGAIEGIGRYLGPVHVYRMTEEQAGRSSVDDRLNYASAVLTKKYAARGTRWYADNTREPIRDETLREGLVAVGAGQVGFLTAYQDRESAGFRKTISGLAWGSFAWFVSEPDSIVILRDGAASPARLADLLAR